MKYRLKVVFPAPKSPFKNITASIGCWAATAFAKSFAIDEVSSGVAAKNEECG
jgi:hypothetical protein